MAKTKTIPSAIDLTKPLDPKTAAAQPLLDDLQGNVLKGHGRKHTIHVFLQFKKDKIDDVKQLICQFATDVLTTASQQLQETNDFRQFGISGSVFGNFLLSKKGYEALGIAKIPDDTSFQNGLKQSRAKLNDPDIGKWESGYREEIHAMLLLADNDVTYLNAKARDLMTAWRRVAKIVAVEIGLAMRNRNDDHIEHFGYVDGRSQPLLLTTDIEAEETKGDGTANWKPDAPLNLVLVHDPNGSADSFGSYFVFRKLEQNVRGFKETEKQLAKLLKLEGEDEERAGAMVVGRFEDGTPLVLQKGAGMHNPVPNNFNYGVDKEGLRCPFVSHIRKTNPRGDTVRQFGVSEEDERSRRIARRGITYGEREVHPNDNPTLDQMPTDGVGLLFMCFQSNIAHQFEFMQQSWANNPGFVRPNTGIDPVIGQGTGTEPPQHWDNGWGAAHESFPFDFKNFVRMLGGEYFFAPCVSFLKQLCRDY